LDAPDMSRPTHVYVVLSPRPRVGKTLMARVFTEFYRSEGRPVAAYDLDPAEGTLSEFLPGFAIASQIADTRGQMALFDRLIVDDEKPKVLDVGSGLFSHFLKVMTEIDFVPEARQRSVEPIIMFVTGPDRRAAEGYAELVRRFPDVTVVPIFNEAVGRFADMRDAFPARGSSAQPIRVPQLSPSLRLVVDTRPFSFSAYRRGISLDVPPILEKELAAWVKRVFLQVRELELRLLLGRLSLSLAPAPKPPN
jgi:hypothetical protein